MSLRGWSRSYNKEWSLVDKHLAEQMLKLVSEDLQAVIEEKRELDRLYISKQKQERELKKHKAELEEILAI